MAEKKLYMPFDFSSFFVDTIELSDAEIVLYLKMIYVQFEHEVGFKSASHACHLIGKSRRSEAQVKRILETYYDQVDGTWWQSRVVFELNKRAEKLDALRANGAKGGRPKKNQMVFKTENQNESIKGNESKEKVIKGKEEPPISPKGDECASDVSDSKKIKLGEFGHVALTEQEHEKIKTLYGTRLTAALDMLDAYLENKPQKRAGKSAYKSHYAVLKQGGWVYERISTDAKTREPTAKGYSNASMWSDDAVTGSDLKF